MSPSILFLSETKISNFRITSIRQSLNFGIDSVGIKGGLGIFWKSDWKVELKSYGPGHIDTFVTDPNDSTWRFTGFYGNPICHLCHFSLDLITRLGSLDSFPWLIGRDFNEIIICLKKAVEWSLVPLQ